MRFVRVAIALLSVGLVLGSAASGCVLRRPEQRLPTSSAPSAQTEEASEELYDVRIDGTQLVVGTIEFETNSAKLTSHGETVLAQLQLYLHDHREITLIRIEGHTDSRGSPANNKKLSSDRAKAVRAWLIAHAIAPERLIAIGFGDSRPISDNTSEEGMARNRRAEFHVVTLGGKALSTLELAQKLAQSHQRKARGTAGTAATSLSQADATGSAPVEAPKLAAASTAAESQKKGKSAPAAEGPLQHGNKSPSSKGQSAPTPASEPPLPNEAIGFFDDVQFHKPYLSKEKLITKIYLATHTLLEHYQAQRLLVATKGGDWYKYAEKGIALWDEIGETTASKMKRLEEMRRLKGALLVKLGRATEGRALLESVLAANPTDAWLIGHVLLSYDVAQDASGSEKFCAQHSGKLPGTVTSGDKKTFIGWCVSRHPANTGGEIYVNELDKYAPWLSATDRKQYREEIIRTTCNSVQSSCDNSCPCGCNERPWDKAWTLHCEDVCEGCAKTCSRKYNECIDQFKK